MDGARVIERKIRLDGSSEDFVCQRLLLEPGTRAVLRYELDRDRSIAGGLVVPRGSLTIAHYWTDRHYNVYHWVGPGPGPARTIAYYCNVIASTTIATDLVSYEDLVVDVLIEPRGNATVLDEDDLPADLEARHRKTIAQALEALTGGSARRIAAEVERETRRLL